jgi:hypothetical protein
LVFRRRARHAAVIAEICRGVERRRPMLFMPARKPPLTEKGLDLFWSDAGGWPIRERDRVGH